MKRRRKGIVEVLRGNSAEVSHQIIGFVDTLNCASKACSLSPAQSYSLALLSQGCS